MRLHFLTLSILCCSTFIAVPTRAQEKPAADVTAKYREAAIEKWEAEIKKIEERDKTEADPEHAILFIGSSSIRLWGKDIAADLKPWPVIERGYGGAKFSDLAVYADRLVRPHKFDALVIFVGNDVTGGKDDKTPEEVTALFKHVVQAARTTHPDQPIFLIEITPTPSRWKAWPQIKEVNAALKQACEQGKNMHFISTADQYLNADGGPMPELFKEDKLHQNRDGYARWSKIIKEALAKVLK